MAAPAHTAKASVSDAIADEVAELKSSESQLFMYHKLGVYGLIYIAFDTIDVHPTPSEVVQAAARDVFKTKQCLSRYTCLVCSLLSWHKHLSQIFLLAGCV